MIVCLGLFLDGLPNLQTLGKLRIGEEVKELLECDLALECDSLPMLRDAIFYCESVRDFASREIRVDILESEDEHVDFLETQLAPIERMSIQNYIQNATGGETPDGD